MSQPNKSTRTCSTSDSGPIVAVTGASGYIGSHICQNLIDHGYNVRACVRTKGSDRTSHLLQMNQSKNGGSLTLYEADMMVKGAYDSIFKGASAVFHVAGNFGTDVRWQSKTTRTGRPSPVDAALGKATGETDGTSSYDHGVYDSYIEPMDFVLESIRQSETVKRLVFTSSGCAGPTFTEHDVQENAYGKGKVDCEKRMYEFGAKHPTIICCASCPHHVLGPILAPIHDMTYQHRIGEIFAGKYYLDQYWEICDVRDVADTQRRMLESSVVRNGTRYYNTCPPNEELTPDSLVSTLRQLFPEQAKRIKDAPQGMPSDDSGSCRSGSSSGGSSSSSSESTAADSSTLWLDPEKELGLRRHAVVQTIRDTIVSMQKFGMIDRKNVSTKELRNFYNVAEMDGCDAEMEYVLSQLQQQGAAGDTSGK